VLLTALVQAFARWTSTSSVLIDLEGHGREALFDDVDLSRTVGWFTAIFPVMLDLGDVTAPGEALKSVKEQLRRLPDHGIGYGLLRYLHPDPDVAAHLERRAAPEVSFNYLGQLSHASSGPAIVAPAPESSGPPRSARQHRRYVFEINAGVEAGQLRVFWTYSRHRHRRATVERVAHDFLVALRTLIDHCRSPDAGGYTPSDFPRARVMQRDLDRLMGKVSQRSRGGSGARD
jgi:non-ribosomal peptide synthase protein (TIGR01720 family)